MNPELAVLLAFLAMAWLVALALWVRARADRRGRGELVYSDFARRTPPLLRSESYRLVGRPDEVRMLAGGRPVPVELKAGPSPRWGPYPSHRIQLLAYCLLVEESYGTPPPFGILRYASGAEFRVPWTEEARRELFRIRREVDRPYRGEATPTVSKCHGCGYRAVCDVRAV